MKRTGTAALTIAASAGLIAGFLTDQVLTWMRQPTFTPAWSLPIVLALLAVACLYFAWPVRRQLKGTKPGSVDAIRAFRTVTLARSASLVGAASAGFGLGLLAFLLTRPVQPPVGSVTVVGVTIGVAVVLVVAALIAESFCVLPKDDDDDPYATDS
ncbi:DUF3180 domain-containing protein [Microbacterium sp. NC79]|uniref:DUF3180 domain-containing protein n=1 Tax=Microbacterium sp. NC79 TaxID=2851009 RepID=UPI001C2C5E79|nr:DUF3180 domain-containing protein [Microbacterium sp. NC79]